MSLATWLALAEESSTSDEGCHMELCAGPESTARMLKENEARKTEEAC
jgi:hypothetical protein